LVKVYKGDELIAKYQYISKALDELKVFYAKQPPPVARIFYYLNNFIGNYSLTNRDSVSALSYYSKATDGFENSKILDKYSTFSENYARFLLSFDKSIMLNIKYDNEQKVTVDYSKVKKIFLPVYQAYPWDVNLSDYLANIDNRYGQYLYKKHRYKDATGPLDSASYNGKKQSTEYLIKIYSTTSYANPAKLNYYKLRSLSQSTGIKDYMHAADFNGVQKKIIIEIFDRAKGYPYKGIEDQAKWWREARNGIIPISLVEKFSKLQDTAWQNNISFKELVTARLNAESLAPYKDLKRNISKDDNNPKRKRLLDTLYNLYTTNLGKDAFNSDVVKADAVEFFLINGRVFLEKGRPRTAKDIFNKVLKLDPDNKEAQMGIKLADDENDINTLVNTADSIELQSVLGLYLLGKSNTKNALVVINKIRSDFDKAYLKINTTDRSAKDRLSNSYNDLAWHCLQLNIADQVDEYLDKSRRLNPANLYPQENLPHFYLLTGQFEKAKQMYLALKDKEFDINNDLPTFKDGFLSDLKDFKKRGIKNDGIQKMIDILDAN
jgi:hypothetical protein